MLTDPVRYIFSSFLIAVLLMVFHLTCTVSLAQEPAQLPTQRKSPVIWQLKTPLEQPLEEILPINVNTTDAETLMRVPGINRTAARQIVNHRDKNGDYSSLDQLAGFSGISETSIFQLKKYLTVE